MPLELPLALGKGNVTMASIPVCRYRRIDPANLGADSLRKHAEKTAAEVEARRRFFENDSALRSKLYAPLLKTLTPEVQAAAARRAELDRKAFEEKVKTAKQSQPKVVPDIISTHPGAQQAFPPYDDTWIDPASSPPGNAFVSPDKEGGLISTGLSANGSLYVGAGLKLWIIPATAADSILVMPAMLFTAAIA